MILAFEHDKRKFTWKPGRFRDRWHGGTTWRIWWGYWSVSYYPEPGLREFFDWVEHTDWKVTN